VDGDCFEENNLNRQLGCTESTLGLPKAQVLARRVGEINGAVTVTPHVCWFDAQNGPALLAGAQVIVDALDKLSTRYTLHQVAAQLGVPLVHGAIAGYMGQVMTILPGDAGLWALYGAPEMVPERGVETRLGNPSATPMMVSAWQVQEVVKLLLDQGTLLRNRILIMDAEYGEFREVDLAS
ncbi:MAG: HesA/MoeB/ThiF family protein, partial [Chloroflexi bacterium]|nr:HesA/MoeB/ThiF family protein [Chloroflexota bacterium]